MRPLGLPSWSDKLVGEVVRVLLEAYYEPRFSGRSHGFRPGRGCHTSLAEIAETWTGTTWFIEGDISDCFGSLDHNVLLSILSEHIHDNRFLRLIKNMLRAGYLEDWTWNATLSGAPQGGVASPVLSNIYLDRLDKFAETVLIPEYTRGKSRKANPAWTKVANAMAAARRRGDRAAVRELRQQRRGLPARDPVIRATAGSGISATPTITCSGSPARRPKPSRSKPAWRGSCMRPQAGTVGGKTLITHGRTQAARFLGYDITVQHSPLPPRRQRRDRAARPPDGDHGQDSPLPQAR